MDAAVAWQKWAKKQSKSFLEDRWAKFKGKLCIMKVGSDPWKFILCLMSTYPKKIADMYYENSGEEKPAGLDLMFDIFKLDYALYKWFDAFEGISLLSALGPDIKKEVLQSSIICVVLGGIQIVLAIAALMFGPEEFGFQEEKSDIIEGLAYIF
jgi:hypothetical protein